MSGMIRRTTTVQILKSFSVQMSKKSKQAGKNAEKAQATEVSHDPVKIDKNGNIAITILAKPGSARNQIADLKLIILCF